MGSGCGGSASASWSSSPSESPRSGRPAGGSSPTAATCTCAGVRSLTGAIDPLLSARVLLPARRGGGRGAVGTGARPPPALVVAAGRKCRGRRGLGRRARPDQRLGPARRADDQQARVPGRRRTRAPRQPRVDVRRLGAGRVTGAVGHPRRRTSAGRAALVRPARPDRPRRGGLGGRAVHRRGSADGARRARHRARGRGRGGGPHGRAVRRPVPRGGLGGDQRRRVLRRSDGVGGGAAGSGRPDGTRSPGRWPVGCCWGSPSSCPSGSRRPG